MSEEEPIRGEIHGEGEFIETAEHLGRFLNELPKVDPDTGGKLRVSIDTEADSYHCYQEKLCLIQFSAGGSHHALIDPLAFSELSELVSLLDHTEVWMHGADYDITMFRRTFNHVPERIFDTQIAAQLAGHRKFGLSALIEDVFGVTLSKESQRADWGKRPLSEEMLEYALNDVLYLIPLADVLQGKLKEMGRMEWFDQSCAHAQKVAMERPPKDPDQLWRIKGWGRLQPRGWGYLRGLWNWRAGEAERLDHPVFKVMANGKLLYLAERLQDGRGAKLVGRYNEEQKYRFEAAVAEAAELPNEELPRRVKAERRERVPDLEALVDPLKKHRDRVATELDIEATLICTRSVLEDIALHPENAEEQLLPWQYELMKPSIS